jgi:hypothetical protein
LIREFIRGEKSRLIAGLESKRDVVTSIILILRRKALESEKRIRLGVEALVFP